MSRERKGMSVALAHPPTSTHISGSKCLPTEARMKQARNCDSGGCLWTTRPLRDTPGIALLLYHPLLRAVPKVTVWLLEQFRSVQPQQNRARVSTAVVLDPQFKVYPFASNSIHAASRTAVLKLIEENMHRRGRQKNTETRWRREIIIQQPFKESHSEECKCVMLLGEDNGQVSVST